MHKHEKEIAQWRAALGAELSPAAREELELHLRDLIDAELRQGTPPERAFQQALGRLGDASAISAEYAKLDGGSWWAIRAAWWVVLVIVAFAIGGALFVGIVRSNPQYYDFRWLLAIHVATITVGYAMTFLLGGLAICFAIQHFFSSLRPRQMDLLLRSMGRFSMMAALFTAAGVLLGAIWAHYAWGQAWRWDNKEIGGSSVLTFLIAFNLWQRFGKAAPTSTMLWALIGNVIVAGAWFQSTVWVTAITGALSVVAFGSILRIREENASAG